jgi:Ca-activated chloride channel family protein
MQMNKQGGQAMNGRTRAIVAGALVLATAVVGTVARGKGNGGQTAPIRPSTVYFTAPSSGPVTFTGTLDRTAVLRGKDGVVRMELVMGAKDQNAGRSARVPTDLMVILDRSGSMGGYKLEQARTAVRELVAQLGPEDRFGLVTYSNDATLVIPLATADADARARWFTTLAGIDADGGTNMSSGLDLGLDTIERARSAGHVPRAILLSDGLANQGDASHEGLLRRATRAARSEYMLTTVGIGTDFNEYLMTALADAGTGNYYYLKASDDLANVFAREFDGARTTVASGLAVQIEPADGVRVVDAAGYPLEQAAHAVLFRPGALFVGQERRVWVTLAVPSSALGDVALGHVSLSYANGPERTTLAVADVPHVTCVQGEDDFFAAVDASSWTRSVIVDGYNEMQQKVAQEVKAGRRDAALAAIRQFRDDTTAMNAHVQSAPVAGQLKSVDKLEADVGGAFVGDNQPAKQNELSKLRSAAALDERRAGNKR